MESDERPPNDEADQVEYMVTDYTDVFKTQEQFSTRENLCKWLRERGNEHGMVIIISKSDSGLSKKKARIFFACERSGQYREFNGKLSQENHVEVNVVEEIKNKITRRETGTKKCGCPFRLRGRQISVNGGWTLEVQCGVHNHPTALYLEGHSYAGRLNKIEEEYVLDMSHDNSRPKDILFGLKNKFINNKSTIRTIYNARMKNRFVERDGRSQMQQLMWKLKEHGYFYQHRRHETSNVVKDLFFAHPKSVELLRSFPKVVLMDCTYKTNRYKLPLLEIVGVTSTNMTFLIAAAYLEFEREDNYMWACTTLKSLMNSSSLPNVIVTDRELALINAIERVFPTSRYFLCRWHINRNIVANCKKMFCVTEKWNSFIKFWNLLVIADSESSFYDLLKRFQTEFTEYPNAVKYAIDQWVGPYKDRFVSFWTNNVMHFDNNTTNRAESQHALLKRQLGSSQGNFETCWGQIHTLIETSYNAIKGSFEKSRNVVLHKYKSVIFMSLRGMVSICALNKIYDEMKCIGEGVVDPLLCGCALRKTCGLPCGHEISEYMRLEKSIPLDRVDAFWRKLDCLQSEGDVDVGDEIQTRVTQCVNDFYSKIKQASESEKLLMLKRMMEIVNPTTTSLIEPEIQMGTRAKRGRPKLSKGKQFKSTKRDLSKFEYVEPIKDSCSPYDPLMYNVGPSTKSKVFASISRPKLQVVRRQNQCVTESGYINQLPLYFCSYIVRVKDVNNDGHCGFRAIADLLGYGEESWGRIRGDLFHELSTNREFYTHVFIKHGRGVDKVLESLDCYNECAAKKHWFCLPEMGYLVASTYNVALVCLDQRISLTYLPLRTCIPCNPKLICIGFVNGNHFIEVFMREGHPLPHVTFTWESYRYEIASGWKDFYNQPLLLYNEIIGTRSIARNDNQIDMN